MITKCLNCGTVFDVEPSWKGKEATCDACGKSCILNRYIECQQCTHLTPENGDKCESCNSPVFIPLKRQTQFKAHAIPPAELKKQEYSSTTKEVHIAQEMQELWSEQNLIEIAKWQKNNILMILANLAILLPGTMPETSFLAPLITICIIIGNIVCTYKLAGAVHSSFMWFFLGGIGLLVLNGKATKILRDNGIKVGFMGAQMTDIE